MQIDPKIFDEVAKKIVNIRNLSSESEKVNSIIDEMLESNAILQTYATNINDIANQVLHVVSKMNELIPELDGFIINVNNKLVKLYEYNEAFSKNIIEQAKFNNNTANTLISLSNNMESVVNRIEQIK